MAHPARRSGYRQCPDCPSGRLAAEDDSFHILGRETGGPRKLGRSPGGGGEILARRVARADDATTQRFAGARGSQHGRIKPHGRGFPQYGGNRALAEGHCTDSSRPH